MNNAVSTFTITAQGCTTRRLPFGLRPIRCAKNTTTSVHTLVESVARRLQRLIFALISSIFSIGFTAF